MITREGLQLSKGWKEVRELAMHIGGGGKGITERGTSQAKALRWEHTRVFKKEPRGRCS